MRSSHDIVGQASKELERRAWANPGGYTKVSHPTPMMTWNQILSKMIIKSIKEGDSWILTEYPQNFLL